MNVETKVEAEPLARLREPFPPHQISKLPKPTKKDAPKGNCKECGGYHGLPAVHLDYVGHAALTDRLLDTDPQWFWEPLAYDERGLPAFDQSGGLWIKLTVCGVTRLGYGAAAGKSYMDVGAREKEVIGDALRNAAMRFGAALDLWHKGDLHADETEGHSLDGAVSPPSNLQQQLEQSVYPFPEGPAKGITEMKAMVRPLWREIKGCGDDDELTTLLETVPENKALLEQVSNLENPTHRRELWEGDGKDNPGLRGLIEQQRIGFKADLIRAG